MSNLSKLSPEELAQKEKITGVHKDTVTQEMYFLAEFGYYYGWQGILALETNQITLARASELIEATRKVWYSHVYELSLGNFYANKDTKTFNKGMKPIISKMEVKQ